jgi:hypothetical protein
MRDMSDSQVCTQSVSFEFDIFITLLHALQALMVFLGGESPTRSGGNEHGDGMFNATAIYGGFAYGKLCASSVMRTGRQGRLGRRSSVWAAVDSMGQWRYFVVGTTAHQEEMSSDSHLKYCL